MSLTTHATEILGDILAQVPDGPAQAPPGLDGKFSTLIGFAKWIGYALCAAALIFAAVKLAMAQQSGRMHSEGMGDIAKPVVAVVLIGLAPSIISWLI